ncbi:MAG TPA: extensin family protein [Xanthobacteraceae bacterium]
MAALGVAAADDIPLPRPRPPALARSLEATVTPEGPAEPTACQLRLAAGRAVFTPLPALSGPGECGATDVIRLEAIVMPNHERVALLPPPTLRCSMAEAVADWVRADIGPLAGGLGAPLAEIENYDSYDCRGMNRVVGAKLSEHGKANALDIRSVKLTNGKAFRLTEPAVSREFRERMRQSACARFKTVLGPGSDGYHEEHVHVDLAERHGDYRICQWDIREPVQAGEIPLPRPRPIAATGDQKL